MALSKTFTISAIASRFSPQTLSRLAPGVLLPATIALASTYVSSQYGGPVMLYALLFGIAFNFLAKDEACAAGISFSSKTILRIGVALLGVRITFGEIAALGASTVALVVAGVAFTITVGAFIGRRLKLSMDHAILSAGAVAICGASAALAISSVLPNHPNKERNTILTVVGVTTLSTVAMVLYPLVARTIGLDHHSAGIFIGATIHDVAQVIGAGYMISDEAGETAAIVKLMRVACLAPAVVMISLLFNRGAALSDAKDKPPILPLFLVGFLVLMGINSFGFVPQPFIEGFSAASRWCLVTAVAALGVKTSLKDVFAVGPAPITAIVFQTLALAVFSLAGLWLILTLWP